MTDYWLSKFFYDMRDATVREAYRADPDAAFDRYRLEPDVRRAVAARDVAFLSARVNPYLLRYYFGYIGMSDEEFLSKIRAAGVTCG